VRHPAEPGCVFELTTILVAYVLPLAMFGDAPQPGRRGGRADAALHASGARRLTVKHGGPLTDEASELLQRLVRLVEHAVRDASGDNAAQVLVRQALMTWTFHPPQGLARPLVLTARAVSDLLDPGGWIVTPDDHP